MHDSVENGIVTNVEDVEACESNPWLVKDASVFLKYNCPECDYSNQKLKVFTEHALENHPKAKVFITAQNVAEQFSLDRTIKSEDPEYFEYSNYDFDSNHYLDPSVKEETKEDIIEKPRKRKAKKKHVKKPSIPKKEITSEMLTCSICVIEFPSKQLLKSHKLEKHKIGEQYGCLYCNYKVKNGRWIYLLYHIDTKHPDHGEKKHLCSLCSKGFIYESSVKLHKLRCGNEKDQKHMCHICGKHLSLPSLKEHMLLKHSFKDATKLVCEKCGFSTISKQKLKDHIRQKHEIEKHKKCPYCNWRTPQSQKIPVHIDHHHPETGEKKFFCNKCDKGFIHKASHTNHTKFRCRFSEYVNTYTNPNRDTKLGLHCDYCNDILNSDTHAKNHYRCHHPGKPIIADGFTKFHCTTCTEFFFSKNKLERHLNLEHGVKTEKNYCKKCKQTYTDEHNFCRKDEKFIYNCPHCSGEYTSKEGLKFHISRIHEGKNTKYSCKHCDQTYASNQNLQSHIQSVHEKGQDYECKPCGKKFGSYRAVVNHNNQSHSQVNCEICGKQIANPNALKRHKVFVHNDTKGAWLCEKCPKKVFFVQTAFEKHMNEKH